eukprot:GILI01011084.1.p2 GENE.GILI01011084.1~~GILI01011084.1.p2  ORF type:complete len:277 (+),score=54.22 GILI01011084.1:74-832(+)
MQRHSYSSGSSSSSTVTSPAQRSYSVQNTTLPAFHLGPSHPGSSTPFSSSSTSSSRANSRPASCAPSPASTFTNITPLRGTLIPTDFSQPKPPAFRAAQAHQSTTHHRHGHSKSHPPPHDSSLASRILSLPRSLLSCVSFFIFNIFAPLCVGALIVFVLVLQCIWGVIEGIFSFVWALCLRLVSPSSISPPPSLSMPKSFFHPASASKMSKHNLVLSSPLGISATVVFLFGIAVSLYLYLFQAPFRASTVGV